MGAAEDDNNGAGRLDRMIGTYKQQKDKLDMTLKLKMETWKALF